MSIRGLGDAYAFRRLLWLVLSTVVLPTMLLAIYGLYAVRNQRAALRQQAEQGWTDQLVDVGAALLTDVERLDRALHEGVLRCDTSACDPTIDGVLLHDISPLSPGSVGAIETTWVSGEGEPIGTFDANGWRVHWQPDIAKLAEKARRIAPERTTVHLSPLPDVSGSALPTFASWRAGSHGATLPLEGPLSKHRLTLDPSAGSELARSTSWFYLFGLIVLVATVLIGVYTTLSSTMRELRLSRLQTDFVSSISHELRTPLTSIRLFVETLQSGRLQDPDKVAECLDLLGQETDRLSRRIERVLNWARMEAGRRVYDLEPVPVSGIVDDAMHAFRSQTWMDDLHDRVHVDLPSDLPPLNVDRDAIVEAVLNLIQNAVRHGDDDTTVTVSAERRGSQIGLIVSDNGPGIPKAHTKRIFEKFYQVNPLLASTAHGSGLGLSIVRAVVQGHRGYVVLKTEEGKGSQFTLWLPTVPAKPHSRRT